MRRELASLFKLYANIIIKGLLKARNDDLVINLFFSIIKLTMLFGRRAS
jgi:hypothetical protein